MKTYHIWAICAFILVGCAIPLSRQPDVVTEQAADESDAADMAAAESRTLAVEQSAEKTEAEESTDGAIAGDGNNAVPLATSSADTNTDAAEDSAVQANSTTANAALTLPIAIESVDLATLDQTFLEAVSAASDEVGQVDEHRFIQIEDGQGRVWQGESLANNTRTILLMQPMQSGGQTAVRLTMDGAISVGDGSVDTTLAQVLSTADVDLSDAERFGPPDAEIEFVRARETSPGVWSFDVRLNHPDTGWEDYTDGWHVEVSGNETLDGQILGMRILLHPHVSEMPFTRSQGGIEIPEGVTEVQVRSHDLVSGYGIETVVVPISESGSGERYEVTRIQ